MSGEHRGLSLEPEDGAVHERNPQEHTRVIDEIASGEVVTPVHHHVPALEDSERVFRGQPNGVFFHPDIRVNVRDAAVRGFGLRSSDGRRIVQHLPLQIAELNHVSVDHAQAANARGRQVEGGGRSESSGANQENRSVLQSFLSAGPHLWQDDLAVVTQGFLGSKAHWLSLVQVD